MNKEEIRKLLGGYATNTLTESERSALFEAALDDQELFDALQQEQALKDVLTDPPARAEIRQALDRPRPARSSWWNWGGAIATVAAAAVLLIVFWMRPTPLLEKRAEIASAQKPPSPASPSAAIGELKTPLRQAPSALARKPAAPPHAATPATSAGSPPQPAATTAPAPLPSIPSPLLSQAFPRDQQPAAPPNLAQESQIRPQAGVSGGALNRTAIVRTIFGYSLVKQESASKDVVPVLTPDLKRGDLVRVRVSPGEAGVVTLSRIDSAGVWQSFGSVSVQANSSYVLPSEPIVVTADPQKFRLTFEPVPARAKAAESPAQLSAQLAPAPIEITIVAGAR